MMSGRVIRPMPAAEIAEPKSGVERRWDEKPWYQGDDELGSPGCMIRARDLLALVAAAQVRTDQQEDWKRLRELVSGSAHGGGDEESTLAALQIIRRLDPDTRQTEESSVLGYPDAEV